MGWMLSKFGAKMESWKGVGNTLERWEVEEQARLISYAAWR